MYVAKCINNKNNDYTATLQLEIFISILWLMQVLPIAAGGYIFRQIELSNWVIT